MRDLCLWGLMLGSVLPLRAARGQRAGADSVTPAPWVTRGDLVVLGAGALAAWVAQRSDLEMREAVRGAGPQGSAVLDGLAAVGNSWGGGVSVASGAALWLGGRATDHHTVSAAGLRSLEAIVVSGTVTKLLKAGFGRARPRVSPTDAWDVEFGRGWDNDHESFPSGHSTAAFAFAAAATSEVARRFPARAGVVGATTFTLAGVTAYARMHSDAHWLSDVTMGAAIGMASGWAVTRWHATRPGNALDARLLARDAARRQVRPLVVTRPGGTLLGAVIAWR